MKYAGAEWVKGAMHREMSPLGEAVADLFGEVFLGIYHLDQKALNRVDWANKNWITFIYDCDMATVDCDYLTRLVVRAHDRNIRVNIEGCGPHYMRMLFHQRVRGNRYDECPSLEDHVQRIRHALD